MYLLYIYNYALYSVTYGADSRKCEINLIAAHQYDNAPTRSRDTEAVQRVAMTFCCRLLFSLLTSLPEPLPLMSHSYRPFVIDLFHYTWSVDDVTGRCDQKVYHDFDDVLEHHQSHHH